MKKYVFILLVLVSGVMGIQAQLPYKFKKNHSVYPTAFGDGSFLCRSYKFGFFTREFFMTFDQEGNHLKTIARGFDPTLINTEKKIIYNLNYYSGKHVVERCDFELNRTNSSFDMGFKYAFQIGRCLNKQGNPVWYLGATNNAKQKDYHLMEVIFDEATQQTSHHEIDIKEFKSMFNTDLLPYLIGFWEGEPIFQYIDKDDRLYTFKIEDKILTLSAEVDIEGSMVDEFKSGRVLWLTQNDYQNKYPMALLSYFSGKYIAGFKMSFIDEEGKSKFQRYDFEDQKLDTMELYTFYGVKSYKTENQHYLINLDCDKKNYTLDLNPYKKIDNVEVIQREFREMTCNDDYFLSTIRINQIREFQSQNNSKKGQYYLFNRSFGNELTTTFIFDRKKKRQKLMKVLRD